MDIDPQPIRGIEMRREPYYWNVLPLNIREENGTEILSAWGVRPWGREFGNELTFVGWQRVALPQGWSISLEEYNLLLLDDKGQIRGHIRNFFPRAEQGEFLKAVGEAIQTAHDEAGLSKRPRPTGPVLELSTCITRHQSFCLGDVGPYSYWVENAFGERLFGLYEVEVSDAEAKKKLPELELQITDWLKKNYPDWQSHLAYWDTF